MLIAIGIYSFTQDTPPKFFRVDSAQPKGLSLFSSSHLASLESQTLPLLTSEDLQSARPLHFPQDSEHHYIKRVVGEPFILVMGSRSKLDDKEAHYLFINMWHAHIRPETAKVTLQQIIDNPLGYTGSDRNLDAIKQSLEETKKIMIENIDKIIERGEKLEQVHNATIKLQQASAAFEEEARRLNSCRC